VIAAGLGRYLNLYERLALGVTIAWYPGFTHHVTWAALWDFMTAFMLRRLRDALAQGGVKERRDRVAHDALAEACRTKCIDAPHPQQRQWRRCTTWCR
jgi:hypothetical protein